MTLILNEIHYYANMSRSFIVSAADQRVSRPDGTYHSTQKKLFEIPQIKGTVSYFGLAGLPSRTRNWTLISSWLPNFIRSRSWPDIATFSKTLRETLNELLPTTLLSKTPSGFHISGYDKREMPELWYLNNIKRREGHRYLEFYSKYPEPIAHHKIEDPKAEAGRDEYKVYFFRNGDFQAHAASWVPLDEIFKTLFLSDDFKRPASAQQYGDYIRFKFKFICDTYSKWAKRKIIAGPIDVIVKEGRFDGSIFRNS